MDTSLTPWQPAARDDVLAAFLGARKQTTIMAYRQDVTDFAAFLRMDEKDAVERFLASGAGNANLIALNYRANMQERGLQATTINRRLATLRSLTKFARMAGWITWGLEVQGLKTREYKDTSGPGKYHYRKMLAEVDGKATVKSVRDKAILCLLHDIGLRRGELCALDVADVDIEKGTVNVLGKGCDEKQRLTLPRPTLDALKAWLDVRGVVNGPLFTNCDHAKQGSGRLSSTAVYKLVRDLGRKVGVETRPHGLRHLAVTEAVKAAQRAGMGIEEVLDFSRHADLKTLMIYVDRERDTQGKIASMIA